MEEAEEQLIKELGPELKLNVGLKDFASMKVGGTAQYFFRAKKIDELVKAVALAYKLKIPYFILGGGYNIIPSEQGVAGLVIKNECENIAFAEENSQVIVDSGMSLGKLINLAASRNLGGLEFLFGVPGTVGGAVYGNAGAFSYEIGDFVKSIIMLAPKDGEMAIVKRTPEWMEFSYRSSKLKESKESDKYCPVILTVKLQLVRRRGDEILSMMQNNLKAKKESQPLNEKSAGSFFKNIGKVPEQTAGYLLDKAGAKKIRIGGAAVSKKHANFIINHNKATADDIKALAEQAKELVNNKFNIDLKEEVEYIGRW